MSRNRKVDVAGIRVLKERIHGFLIVEVGTDKVIASEAAGITDGQVRIWNKEVDIYSPENTKKFPPVGHGQTKTDIIEEVSTTSFAYYSQEIRSAQGLLTSVVNVDELALDVVPAEKIVTEMLQLEKTYDTHKRFCILEGTSSVDKINERLIAFAQQTLREESASLYVLLQTEAGINIKDEEFSSVRKLLKTMFHDIYYPVRSRRALYEFVEAKQTQIIDRIDRLSREALSSVGNNFCFIHERTIKELFQFTGKLEAGLFLPFKYKPTIPQGILISTLDCYFTLDEECCQGRTDLVIMPTSSNDYFLSVVPYVAKKELVNKLRCIIDYIAKEFEFTNKSYTRIFNIPAEKVQAVIDFFYDIISNPDDHHVVEAINGIEELGPEQYQRIATKDPILKDDNEYEQRETLFQIVRVNTLTEEFLEWQADELKQNVRIETIGLEGTYGNLNTIRQISIVYDNSKYGRAYGELRGEDLKNILRGFKQLSRITGEKSLSPVVPLNCVKHLKIAGISKCFEALLPMMEKPLKEFLRRLVSDNGNYAPFVCEVDISGDIGNGTTWDPSTGNAPCGINILATVNDVMRFMGAYYPEEFTLLKRLSEEAVGDNTILRNITLALVAGTINKFMSNGTTILPKMEVNQYRSEGDVMGNFISEKRNLIKLIGYTPIKLEVLQGNDKSDTQHSGHNQQNSRVRDTNTPDDPEVHRDGRVFRINETSNESHQRLPKYV